MKKQKRQESKRAVQVAPVPAASPLPPWWMWLIGLGALFFVFVAYGAGLHRPVVLNDLYFPYTDADAPRLPLLSWLRFQRPLLMFSYWVNYQMAASDPHVYH